MTLIEPRPGILDIAPYVGGESRAVANPRLGRPIRLASNEGALGPAPAAMAAYEALAGEIHRYPDGGSTALSEALARLHGLDPARIVCGAGSDELISLVIRAYAGPGDEVVHSAHAFLMYKLNAMAAGATPVAVPDRDLRADVDAMLAAVGDRTRLVFLANPDNPTGSWLPRAEIERLHAGLPSRVLLVLDSAYAEYVDRPDHTDGLDLAEGEDNVCVLRTFSKIYGLSGLRVGWGYFPSPVAGVLHRIRSPFNVNAAAQAAALAALGDTDFVAASRAHNDAWLPWTAARIAETGLTVHPSAGNFVLVDFSGTGVDAEAARLALRDRGILLRQMGAYGLPDCLRLSIGTEEEMRVTVDAAADLMREAARPGEAVHGG
ncbi:MAG: histidinol-phosphate transaminase [Azospirillaceae bacterium]